MARMAHWLSDGSCYDYGSRVFFSPRNKPNLKKYGKFSEEIDLCCDPIYLFGSFDFMPKDTRAPARLIIDAPTWMQLRDICQARSILPPADGQDSEKNAANVLMLRQKLGGNGSVSAEDISSLNFVQRIWEGTMSN